MDCKPETLVQMEETIQSTITRNDHDHENEAKQEGPSWLIGIYERLKGTHYLKEIEVIMKENQFQTEYELIGYLWGNNHNRKIWNQLQPADDAPVDGEKLDRLFWYITNDAQSIPESAITHMRQKISEWNHGEFCKFLEDDADWRFADDTDLYQFAHYILYYDYSHPNVFKGPLTKGKEYANPQQKTRTILRNVNANESYIPLKRGGVYEYEFNINAPNDYELDMDVGWALIRKEENEYAIAEEWTWNGFRGTTTHKIEGKDEKMIREIECKGIPNKLDAWKNGERVVVRCDLTKGCIEVVNTKPHSTSTIRTVFRVADDIIESDDHDPIICPVVYAVRPQSIATHPEYDINNKYDRVHMEEVQPLFEYWTNQIKQQIDTIEHPMWTVDVKRIEDEDDEKKEDEKRKQTTIDITKSDTNIVTRNNDKYLYSVEIKQDYVDCDIGWILVEESEDEKE
eukprot:30282_1